MRTLYQWTQLEFDYPNEDARQSAIKSGEFNNGQIFPVDIDVYKNPKLFYSNKYFITTPRFFKGVPVTLGVVTNKRFNNNPIITPYPSWEWQNFTGCNPNRLVSVFRTAVCVVK